MAHQQLPALGGTSGHELGAMEQTARRLRGQDFSCLRDIPCPVGTWPLHVCPELGLENLASGRLAEAPSWGEEKINSRMCLLQNTCIMGKL